MPSDERYHNLIQAAPDAILLTDLEGRIEMMNAEAIAMIGASDASQMMGRSVFDLIALEDRARARENVQRTVELGTLHNIEYTLLRVDGSRWDAEVSASVVQNDEGKPVGFISVMRDITQRKRTEDESSRLTLALKRRARQLTALSNAVRAVASTLNPQDVLGAVIDEARNLLEAEIAAVLLRDPGSDDLVFAAAVGPGSPAFLNVRLPITQGIAGWVMRERLPAVVNDVQRDPRFYPAIDAATNITARSLAAVPIKYKGAVWGVVEAINKTSGEFTLMDSEMLESLAGSAAVAMENARLFDQVQSGRRRLRTLSRQLVEVQEAERRHIARELHDEIGQALTGLKLMLDMSMGGPAEAVQDSLAEAQSLTNDLLMRVRELSLNLRPAMLDDLGLAPTLVWHIERYMSMTNIGVDFRHARLDQRFSPEIETAAYRIVQEALTNVARHAQVSQVTVRVWADEDRLGVQVEDLGVGFDVEAALASAASSGLLGMRERAALLDGQLTLESSPGEGTCLTVELPLRQTPEASER